ncbi:MAG: TraR/DksA family transcriptional regulator [Myxococcota bacterium]
MVARPREKELTPTQRKELVDALHAKRDELRGALRTRRQGAGASEERAGDEADQALRSLAGGGGRRHRPPCLMDRDAKLLREVERALEKVNDGSYGLCEGTDEPIGYARLRIRPWTRYSVTYKEELEREAKRTGG